MYSDEEPDDIFDIEWSNKDLHWTTRYYILCYGGNMKGLKKILTEKKDNESGSEKEYMDTISTCIGICHLSGNPEMAAYLIEHFSLSQSYLKSQAWLIISKTLDDLSVVRTIISSYGFTKDDIIEFSHEMFKTMCGSLFAQIETMHLYIWAFTELGLPRENSFQALSEAVNRGRNNAASWLIDHFDIMLIELCNTIPNRYDINTETFEMLLDKYSVIDKILLPVYGIGQIMREYILYYSEPTNTYPEA